ncbi:MAG TPA: hypothetical protein VF132_13930, partial [Rudaea sp.]
MHRSGTSATARIIHLLGAAIANDLIPAGIGNERGHWESRAVQELHNSLLAELDSDIYSPVNIRSDWFGSAQARPWVRRIGELLAKEYAGAKLFVIKDPRIALFLPLWIEAMRESSITPRFVLPFRHPDAVATSLQARERRLGSGNELPRAQGIAVWLRYVLAAEKDTRGHARAFLAFDALLADWRAQFARLARQLEIAWPDVYRAEESVDAFLERSTRHRETIETLKDTTLGDLDTICREVHAAMEQAVHEPQSPSPIFDTAAQALAGAERLLGPHIIAREQVFRDALAHADDSLRRGEAERSRMHQRFADELKIRDDNMAAAAAHARSLEQDRDRAVEYARSLKESLDSAVEYARALERARVERAPQDVVPVAHKEPSVFFTIASRNYLAYATTLMQSVAEHYPDAPRYLILADRDEADNALVGAPFTTIPAETLDIPDFDALAFRYNIMEFNTAIKPYAFAHLRTLHPHAGIVYLDPDVLVTAPLADVESAFADGALAVLTPHLLEPIDDDRHPGERQILASGTYNCGFVAIGPHADADRLNSWWADRLEFGAYSDVANGLFTDQKWIDLVPGLFDDVRILRDPGYNVAYWNLSQRPVSRREAGWFAGERPLVFAHFSGVDVDRPEQFSKHQNRHTRASIGELQPLYTDYLARLTANGHADHRAKPYAFGRFADGEPICDPVRAVYRRYFDKGAAQPQREPFAMDRALYDLPCEELPVCDDAPVTRLMYAVWKMRVDLQRAFDLSRTDDRNAFVHWFVR